MGTIQGSVATEAEHDMTKTMKDRGTRADRKYEFVQGDERVYDGHVVRRIRAVVDIVGTDVKAGDVGGYVESESNLSNRGSCWVYDNAVVRNHAHVIGDAKVMGRAEVYGGAMVRDVAAVCDTAMVGGRATIHGNARVMDRARVEGCADIGGNARIASCASVDENAVVSDDAMVCDGRVTASARVFGKAVVSGGGCVAGNAMVSGHAGISGCVIGNATVSGYVHIPRSVTLSGNADVDDNRGFVAFFLSWNNDCVVYTRSNGCWWAFSRIFTRTEDLLSAAHLNSERHGREIDVLVEAVKKLGCVDDMFPCGSEDTKPE